jgi:hypothetical protein
MNGCSTILNVPSKNFSEQKIYLSKIDVKIKTLRRMKGISRCAAPVLSLSLLSLQISRGTAPDKTIIEFKNLK